MLDFAKKLLEKLLISAFSYPLKQVKVIRDKVIRDTLRCLFKVACYYLPSWTYLKKYLICDLFPLKYVTCSHQALTMF